MAAATVTKAPEGVLASEHVQLTVSNAETYVSKLSKVEIVQATGNEDVDAHLNAVISADNRTITLNYAGQTDKKVSLSMFGRR